MDRKILRGMILLAIFINFVGLMPNIRHPDEPPLHEDSIKLVVEAVSHGDFNPHTYKYGTINYYFHAIFYFPILISGYFVYTVNTLVSSSFLARPIPFSEYYLAQMGWSKALLFGVGRGVTALFGLGNVVLTYLIGKKLFGKKVGILGAFFLAIAPLHARDSHYITTDVPFLFFLLLALLYLIKVVKRGKFNDYALAGLFSGISIAIRFFPVVIVPYSVAMFLIFGRQKRWFPKMLVGVIFVFVGLFVGVPFLFLDQNGPAQFMADLEKYALPWYSTPLSVYVFSLGSYLASGGKESLVPLATIWPKNFRPYLVSYTFFKGFGVFGSIAALGGLLLVVIKRSKMVLLFLSTPLFVTVYSSYYLRVMYERVMIPVLPFMAILAAYSVLEFSRLFRKRQKIVVVSVVALLSFISLWMSTTSSLSCGQAAIHTQSEKYIEASIPPDVSIADLPSVSFPGSPEFGAVKLIEMFPEYLLSLEESRAAGAEYAFVNASRLEYDTYAFFNEFFVSDPQLYKNSFAYLALYEYQTRTEVLKIIEKPSMCEKTRIYYYKFRSLPTVKGGVVATGQELNWMVRRYGHGVVDEEVLGKEGVLIYRNRQADFIAPRLMSTSVAVKAGMTYTFSLKVRKTSSEEVVIPKIFIRMDFFDGDRRSLWEKMKRGYLLIKEGPTQLYYEKEMWLGGVQDEKLKLGKAVALSARKEVGDGWEELWVSAVAPQDASRVVLSVQADNTKEESYEVREIELTEGLN